MKTPAFSLSIIPSKWIAGYLIALHFLVVLSLLYLALPDFILFLLIIATMASAGYYLRRYCYRRHPRWIDSIEYSHQHWLLHYGRSTERAILKSATVWRLMVVLNFQTEGGACSLVLLADNTCSQQRRQLRVMLKHRSVYGGDKFTLQ